MNMLSIVNQTKSDWEHIIVDDGSDEPVDKLVEKFKKQIPDNYQYLRNEQNLQRAISRNRGMKVAKGDWICWLDADDYYLPHYLEVMDQAIERYPETKVFNFNGIVVWNNWGVTVKKSRQFERNEEFKSGEIMSGAFIFKREALQKSGFLPEVSDPYLFGREMKWTYREIEGMYPDREDLGNPWGDDWAMFYKLTREYQPQYLDISPYVVNIRGERKLT
jgi:glycosyltransferase involved in cell wall biosynthesis